MHTFGRTITTLTCLAAFGTALTGCPVWTDADDRDDRRADGGVIPPPPPPPPPPATCTSHSDCPGGYCNAATRRCASTVACTMSSQCAAGFYCDAAAGRCLPGSCGTNADCAARGAGLICDAASRSCVPGGRCTTDAQCAATPATPVCLGGSCQARANQCQFDYQCTGSGQACVDGRCVVGCTAGTASTVCAPGQVCTNNRCAYPTGSGTCGAGCASTQVCVNNVCLDTCNADSNCRSGFMCDNGVCRVDTRPRPFCTMDSQCNMGSVCYNGACRRQCPNPAVMPDGDCMRVDVQFNLCRSDMMGRSLCTSSNEVMPQCARTAQCSAGRTCVNARCQ